MNICEIERGENSSVTNLDRNRLLFTLLDEPSTRVGEGRFCSSSAGVYSSKLGLVARLGSVMDGNTTAIGSGGSEGERNQSSVAARGRGSCR